MQQGCRRPLEIALAMLLNKFFNLSLVRSSLTVIHVQDSRFDTTSRPTHSRFCAQVTRRVRSSIIEKQRCQRVPCDIHNGAVESAIPGYYCPLHYLYCTTHCTTPTALLLHCISLRLWHCAYCTTSITLPPLQYLCCSVLSCALLS